MRANAYKKMLVNEQASSPVCSRSKNAQENKCDKNKQLI
jgi:hypothetical protein